MESRKRLRKKYEEFSSSDEIIIDIENFSQIPTQTSKWNNEHVLALNIEYKNIENVAEIIQPSDLTEEDNFKKLILKNWSRNDFLVSDDDSVYKSLQNRKITTIVGKIKSVLLNEMSSEPIRETKVDSFIMTLLSFLEFDEYPFYLHPQFDYTAFVDNFQHKITSKVEFMISIKNTYIILIVEDKHPKKVSEYDDWSEPQIAGEIFGAANYNSKVSTQQRITYPLNIYAIRVVGTKITFYKATVTRKYLEETENRLPIKHKLEINRFPPQANALPNERRELTALDFTNEDDRILILSIMKALYKMNK